jgi:hypothetical protein
MSVSCAQGAVRKAVATKEEGRWEGGGAGRYFCFGRIYSTSSGQNVDCVKKMSIKHN